MESDLQGTELNKIYSDISDMIQKINFKKSMQNRARTSISLLVILFMSMTWTLYAQPAKEKQLLEWSYAYEQASKARKSPEKYK